jgi:hypothetical protein
MALFPRSGRSRNLGPPESSQMEVLCSGGRPSRAARLRTYLAKCLGAAPRSLPRKAAAAAERAGRAGPPARAGSPGGRRCDDVTGSCASDACVADAGRERCGKTGSAESDLRASTRAHFKVVMAMQYAANTVT